MSAYIGAVVHGQETISNGEISTRPHLDLRVGGQHGLHSRIGGSGLDGLFEEWQSNQAYVRKNIIAKVIDYPKAFDLLPNTDQLVYSLQALIETRAVTIDGLTAKLTVSFGEHPVGNTQETQEEVLNVQREKSSISVTFNEIAGSTIERFIEFCITYLYMHPDLKYPLIANSIDESPDEFMYLPGYKTFSCLFMEPDVLHRRIERAWLSVNMMFKEGGEVIGKRTQDQAGELVEHSIPFTSITMYNESVREFANEVFQSMVCNYMMPSETIVKPLEEVEPTLQASNSGYDRQDPVG